MGDVRVITLNLWGRSGAWSDRRSVLIEGLRELRPDLVAFQEPVKTDSYDQVLDLVGQDFHVVHHNAGLVGDADHHGASIASRWPLGKVREVDCLGAAPRALQTRSTTWRQRPRPGPCSMSRRAI